MVSDAGCGPNINTKWNYPVSMVLDVRMRRKRLHTMTGHTWAAKKGPTSNLGKAGGAAAKLQRMISHTWEGRQSPLTTFFLLVFLLILLE